MSNELAIAAVTATLAKLLVAVGNDLPPGIPSDFNIGNFHITTKPPDKARATGETRNQLNLFLYQASPNGAMRNMEMPGHAKPGESGQPPVAITLSYLLTAYGNEDEDTAGHILLGQAMRILHDKAVLLRSDVKNALPGNDLHEQIERVRITLLPLLPEEISKLWTAFQIQYRLSVAYQASVVLIDSRRPLRTPLPILTRSVTVQPSMVPPFPTLEAVIPSDKQPSAHLGDVLALTGHHLDGDTVVLRFIHPRLADPIEVPVPAAEATATRIELMLPDDPGNWPAGLYTVAAIITKAGKPNRITNQLPFSIAPEITTTLPAIAPGNLELQLDCRPEVLPSQRASLLLGDRDIPAKAPTAQTATLAFDLKKVPPATYLSRLRIDGVDSLLVDHSKEPPIFFEHTITVT